MIEAARVEALWQETRAHLLRLRNAEGYWEGYLSSSALATATALSALALAGTAADEPLVGRALTWLTQDQNADGGWGDSPESPSNLSTTLLTLAAMTMAATDQRGSTSGRTETGARLAAAIDRAWGYVTAHAGRGPGEIAAAVRRIYGEDRTFAVPILMNCALAGLVSWPEVPSLPCELAAVPQNWYSRLRLQVVSYALPALIAVGLVVDRHRRSALTPLRRALTPRLLRQLAAIQPANGGFLEAIPLTAFVAMSLIAAFGPQQPVARRCLAFLRASVRPDGSWPIDTNLAIWVTTGALNALMAGEKPVPAPAVRETLQPSCAWVSQQQFTVVHPYTGAAPGGFGWTHLPGAVPDADDTAGALLMLRRASELGLPVDDTVVVRAAQWLADLQNDDGGWPTFCRGWGQLPFDRSCPDITAHALRALRGWGDAEIHGKTPGLAAGWAYLERTQRPDGSWLPLWFGNQQAPDQGNPVLGTARVLLALASGANPVLLESGVAYLRAVQNRDGGWGGDRALPSTVEETALAVSALAKVAAQWPQANLSMALERGLGYLERRVADGTWTEPTPIGLYFASLWYAERLYPVIWTVEALGRLRGLVKGTGDVV